MARFNLDDYETVESRIKRFYEAHKDGRIVTEWENGYQEVNGPRVWVVKATVYLDAGDQANGLAKATGYATETDGTGGANNVDALANCETSSIGRALANLGMSGNKRASREEMEKVARVEVDWKAKGEELTDVDSLRKLYAQARAAKAPSDVLDWLKARGETLNS